MTVRLNKAKLERLIRETPERADQMLRGVATEIVNDIVLSFGSGVSAAGDPPGVDTGTLRASMRWSKDGKLRYLVQDGVIYGIMLEWGTENMAARPFVTPVFEEWRQRKFADYVRDFGVMR